ncbi:MAG TPA: chromosome segregation protein SMC [Thiobacillaceae bacterium]|nr:chromosome segregation protein SMC [Thiobacillaceae bacterium]
MRLTSIKLAGFKSFVDPTTISIPAQLTGVVGPNGCGKSNVIDAVRWVMGESSAKHLRGESMQDVIFNGSTARKPVSRASVELLFDNSQGKAAGQWSTYAEISVKRVLTRNGESTYYINNIHVRRRDVADLFLGTGLGARAYAIIEQGMISRIIEAKPEELRAYLEEAAGISKYKERRKETEARLKDARDNLNRVQDIRRELTTQIEKLAAQAEVARQYKQHQTDLSAAQQMLWYVKKRDAQSARGRLARDLGEAGNRLEAETSRLREIEKNLEHTRTEHYAAQDTYNTLQGEFYAAQAEVSRIEQEFKHLRESRERLQEQLQDLEQRQAHLGERGETAAAALAEWAQKKVGLADLLCAAEQGLERANAQLPAREEALKTAQQAVAEAQRELSQAEQARQVDETHLAHARKLIQQLDERQRRLSQERDSLPRPDAAALSAKEVEAANLAASLDQIKAELEQKEAQWPELEAARTAANQDLDRCRQALHLADAELAALKKLQDSLRADEKLGLWLNSQGLGSKARLFDEIDVEPGWEAAVEALLRERLQALEAETLPNWFDAPPPARLTLVSSGSKTGRAPGLVDKIQIKNPALEGALAEWLAGVKVADSHGQAKSMQESLAEGERIVTRQGHVLTRHSVTFHGPHTPVEGVLARSRDIERLEHTTNQHKAQAARLEAALEAAGTAMSAAQQLIQQLRHQAGQAQNRQHTAQMEVVRLQQALERITQRRNQIELELAEVEGQLTSEKADAEAAEHRLIEHRNQIEFARERVFEARQGRDRADRSLSEARERQRLAERSLQETQHTCTTCYIKFNELTEQLKVISEESAGVAESLVRTRLDLSQMDDVPLSSGLQLALDNRIVKESALSNFRNNLEDLNNRLRAEDEARIICEQSLSPLRERMEQLRLKDQELLMTETQFDGQLKEVQSDQEALRLRLERDNPRAGNLQTELARLNGAIADLGPVNLAALHELEQARKRDEYLSNQHSDLLEATQTLEAAIRKIDLETRGLLKQTFNEVNSYLAELFPQIFGGGHAELVLTGDDLLDAGIQIVAQPPGKRNSSIHLLSGGEKALTALSLVFSLFKLNPAPFCLLDEVDAPLDDPNTMRYCDMVKRMSIDTQFLFITHNRITMEMAHHLAGVTMNEPGVSRIVAVDVEEALRFHGAAA